MSNVSVVIPIGPRPIYKSFIERCVNSVLAQTIPVDDILLIDDGAGLDVSLYTAPVRVWASPWNVGCADAFNFGIALARHECVIMLGVDDVLTPTCVEDCLQTYQQHNQKDAWYALSYQVNGVVHHTPNNACMVTKNLWKWTKGFPPSGFAGPDALLLSCLMVHAPDRIIHVAPGKPNVILGAGDYQDTHHQASFFLDEMNSIRNKETSRFTPDHTIILK